MHMLAQLKRPTDWRGKGREIQGRACELEIFQNQEARDVDNSLEQK